MCGTHTKEAALMRFALLWIRRTCCLFTMTVKGTWTDMTARPPFPYNNFSREGVHLLSPMV